ncbi:B3 domain-containing protein Os03g0619800 [Physcomitrium patens]|uniref:TF-B3 domain-containing protein n=1 Tax=Physcomitrium patens TaxID=3218 RepID=A0A2K1IMZ2_PHYPA|nr:uncharacterized protein LOC112274872 [Physcomitrium patens]PNR30645.1 hypothetical protein PHYPA_026961 [Physcomitrium patens]|eukprot:XP_024360464.1 uncharacterized protein LOC112274872 [Physcomitrella patens]
MKKVCEECRRNCLRLHGAEEDDVHPNLLCTPGGSEADKNVQTDRHPSFLKTMTESTIDTLKLPRSFLLDNSGRLSDSVILEGPCREQWRVELHGYGQSFNVSFGQGWSKFVVDHVLQVGDHLVFFLLQKSYFQVEVYDGFGVQKRSALDAVNTPLKTNTKNVDVVQQSLDLDHGVVQTEQKKPESATQPENAAQPLIDLIQSSESESMLMSARKIDMIIAEALRSEDSGHPIMKSPEVEKRKVLPPHVLVNGTVTSKRRPVTELEKARALQAASSLELVKPNVLVVMTKSHVYRGFLLSIPKRFSKDWLPSETKEVTLTNKSGHTWPAKWLASQGGLSAGWRRFSLDHRLEEHDVCVLELVDKANLVLLVHIFRVLGSPEEDEGLYFPTNSAVKAFDGKRNISNSPQVHDDHKGVSPYGNGSESDKKGSEHSSRGSDGLNDKSTSEPDKMTNSLKRKICVLGLEALPDKTKALGDQSHRETGTAAIHDVQAAEPDLGVRTRDPCGAELRPTAARQDLVDFRSTLMKLTKDLLVKNGVGSIVPAKGVLPGNPAANADDVHEQLTNFVDFPTTKRQHTLPSVSQEGDGKDQSGEDNANLADAPIPEQHTPSVRHERPRKELGQEYKVVHIYKGRSVGTSTEFLAELEGYSESIVSKLPRDDDTGFLWVPSNQFSWDMQTCCIE